MEVDLSCPQCGEPVGGARSAAVGQRDARYQHATCPQCHIELVRDADVADGGWNVDQPGLPPDEELGAGD